MTIMTLPQTQTLERSRTSREFVAPDYAFRDMPSPSDLPRDEIGREIAILLHENPGIASQYGEIDLTVLPLEAKVEILASVKAALGIMPIRRRRLGYVGP